MSADRHSRLKQWLDSGEARLHPLSFPQRELWETSPVPVADRANHICCLIYLRGRITPEESHAAVQRVVDRQEVLRLSFLPGKEQALQMIRRKSEPNFKFRELSPAQASAENIEEMANEVFHEPFDLVQGPLYRVELLRRAADDHVVVFTIHHAIADGWTLGVFVRELCAAYLQGMKAQIREASPLPGSYADWSSSERAFWQPGELERCVSYWKPALAGVRRLWNAHQPTNTPGVLGRLDSHIFAELGRAVRELARRSGVTLFSTLLTAFEISLSKQTGVTDILVGTPVANRSKQTVRDTMGYFAGIVPIRGQVDRDLSISEMLRSVHQTTVDSFAHAMPFAELVRALGIETVPGDNPVFEVRFALQNHPVPDVALPGLSAQLRMRSTGTPRFDLGCEITEDGDALEVVWLSRRNLFSRQDLQGFHRNFEAVLAGLCGESNNRVAELMR